VGTYHSQKKHPPHTWPHLFMKLYGKTGQRVYPVGSLLPFHSVSSELDQIPDSALCGLTSAVPSEERGVGERAGALSSALTRLCVGRSLSWSCALCYLLIRGIPCPCHCRDPESVCKILASCCTSTLLNCNHVLQHKAVQSAISESHSFAAQGRNRPAKITLTKRFAASNS